MLGSELKVPGTAPCEKVRMHELMAPAADPQSGPVSMQGPAPAKQGDYQAAKQGDHQATTQGDHQKNGTWPAGQVAAYRNEQVWLGTSATSMPEGQTTEIPGTPVIPCTTVNPCTPVNPGAVSWIAAAEPVVNG